jgi:hypothetical protein
VYIYQVRFMIFMPSNSCLFYCFFITLLFTFITLTLSIYHTITFMTLTLSIYHTITFMTLTLFIDHTIMFMTLTLYIYRTITFMTLTLSTYHTMTFMMLILTISNTIAFSALTYCFFSSNFTLTAQINFAYDSSTLACSSYILHDELILSCLMHWFRL